MKNVRLPTLFLIVSIVILACKKDKEEGVTGEWEPHKVYGGFPVLINDVYPAGNSNTMRFFNGRFEKRVEGGLVKEGMYTLTKDSVYYCGDRVGVPDVIFDKLTLFSTDTLSHSIYASSDTPILDYGASAHDGLETLYIRKK